MGVAGCGKSTFAKRAATYFSLPFFEGDDFHPRENIKKMQSGKPLDDVDREAWIDALADAISRERAADAIVACSALNGNVRARLQNGSGGEICYVWLTASFETIERRLKQRKNHFMSAAMLRSQMDALTPPDDAIVISVEASMDDIFNDVRKAMEQRIHH